MYDARPWRMAPIGGDWIHLRNLQVTCTLGLYPAERVAPRTVTLQVSFEIDSRRAGQSDKLTDTIDYAMIEEEILAEAKRGVYFLIESLAQRAAEVCLSHKQILSVRVIVEKGAALPHTECVAIEILRKRD